MPYVGEKERFVVYVGVASMPATRAQAYVEEFRTKFMAINEIGRDPNEQWFFIATRDENGTRIERL